MKVSAAAFFVGSMGCFAIGWIGGTATARSDLTEQEFLQRQARLECWQRDHDQEYCVIGTFDVPHGIGK